MPSSDINRVTDYRYNADGKLLELIARNATTGDQVTRWDYGTTLADSGVASFEFLRRKTSPDGGQVQYGYNALGEITGQSDQNGTVRAFGYDKLGRLTGDQVVTLGTGVDGAVRGISRSYEVRGMLQKVTSTDVNGGVVNELELAYNALGQLASEAQAHGGAVSAGSPKTTYAYESPAADGSKNTARRLSLTYPDNRVLNFDYGTAGGVDDLCDRIQQIKDGVTALARYTRRGAKATVRVEYLQPGYELTYLKQAGEGSGDGGDQYTGLDRFGRITDIRWLKPGTTPLLELERVQYGFDRASNRTWRKAAVAPLEGWDEQFSYDGLYQLSDRKRGTLSGGVIPGTPAEEELFGYDPTGNWLNYQTKAASGATTLNQNRTHNAVNEITAMANPASAVGYDEAGNMTTMPKVGQWTASQTLKWDVWNRLVKISEGAVAVGTYQYDGLTRRTLKQSSPGGTAQTRHYYYSDQWQVLEERVDAGTVAERQFIWGLRYADDLILRDRSGTTPSRLYALHDQWHVTGVTDASGLVQERYAYEGFGLTLVLTAAFTPLAASLFDWETRYGAYRYDPESKLYQVRYRYLQPTMGRWLSRDPEEYEDSVNLFVYVRNRAINRVDPSGRRILDSLMGLFGGRRTGSATNGGPFCKKVCKSAARNKKFTAGGGTCICFCGTPCACLFDFDGIKVGACPLVDACGLAHEQQHCNDQKCDPKRRGLYSPTFDPRWLRNRECQLRRKELKCLKSISSTALSEMCKTQRSTMIAILEEALKGCA